MQQTGRQQCFHHLGNATGLVQVHGQVFAAGFEVAQHRGLDAYALEVVNRPFHFGRVGNGQKVQHGIGRATGGHDHGHGVFNRLAGDDVARLDVLFDGLDQHLGRFLGRVHFLVVRIGHGGGVGQGDAQGLEGRAHGVGRVHAAAGAGAGDGAQLDLVQVFVAHAPGRVLAHGLEHADDVEVAALVFARKNSAAVDVNGRHIGAQHAHQSAWHVLVAAAHHQHAVHPLALHAGLYTVGNHLAADQ